jgi:hypothetical protein
MKSDKTETKTNSGHNTPLSAAFSNAEIAALKAAASDLSPALEWIGLPLNHSYKTGHWSVKINREREEEPDSTELFCVDVRSYHELWKRLVEVNGKLTNTDMIGGRRVDGWINPGRDLLPENDQTQWRTKNGKPQSPWIEESRIVLRRLSNGQLLTWSAMYSDRRGMGKLLDAVMRDAEQHPGLQPVVRLVSISKGDSFIPDLPIMDWRAFGDGASPPADARRIERLKEELRLINEKYSPKAIATAKKSSSDIDDEIPF